MEAVHDGMYQDKLQKRHARLCATNTEKLSALTGRDFAAEDRTNLYRIGQILKLANELSGYKMSVRMIDEGRSI